MYKVKKPPAVAEEDKAAASKVASADGGGPLDEDELCDKEIKSLTENVHLLSVSQSLVYTGWC